MKSSSRNGAKVIWLAVHTTEGMMRVQALRDWTAWAGSSHASSDETGALWGPEQGFVPYDRMAWTLRNGNPISDNIEQCGWARWTRAEWLARPLLLDATARWLAERSKARGIPLVHLSLADIRARKPGVLGHGDYTYATNDGTHTDPGPNYPWDVVIDKANAYATQEDDVSAADVFSTPIHYVLPDGTPAHMSFGEFCQALVHRTQAVNRGGEMVPMLQEIADAKTNTLQMAAKLDGVLEVTKTLAAARGGDIDVPALLARIDERIAAGFAEGVDVRVIVGDDKPAA